MDEEQMTNMLKQLINEHLEKCNFCIISPKLLETVKKALTKDQ